jgi:hypothetical protein
MRRSLLEVLVLSMITVSAIVVFWYSLELLFRFI